MADNPSAFPGGNPSRIDGRISDGMTLRDWFAGQALAGLLAAADYPELHMPNMAYQIADAMLAERSK